MAIVLPEITLIAHLEGCLTTLRNELEAHPTEPEKTWLFRVFGEQHNGTFRYFDEAAALLLGQVTGQDPLRLTLGFPHHPSGPPSVHVLLPGESTGKTDTLGLGQQPLATYYDEDEDDEDLYAPEEAAAAGSDGTLARSFAATYNLMIVAQTSQQAVLLYHLLRALLIASLPSLATELLTPTLGGQDVQLDSTNGPWEGLYMRTLSLSLSYETRVPALQPATPTAPVGGFRGTAL